MKYNLKKSIIIALVFTTSYIGFLETIFAEEIETLNSSVNNTIFLNQNNNLLNDETLPIPTDFDKKIEKRSVNTVRYRKENVRKSTEYGPWRRASLNLKAGSKGGSISVDRSVSVSGSISGNVHGINVSFGGSASSKKGYTLHVAPHTTRYIGFRAKYSVERGTRVVYDALTGKVLGRNSYTAKRVITGEYGLLKG